MAHEVVIQQHPYWANLHCNESNQCLPHTSSEREGWTRPEENISLLVRQM